MRTFTDQNLLTWEAYASGGKYGLVWRPKIIFHCLSDLDRRAKFVILEDGDQAAAADLIEAAGDEDLRDMLRRAVELE